MAGKEEKRLLRVIVIFFIGLILYFSSSALGRKWEYDQYIDYNWSGYRVINTEGQIVSDESFSNISEFNIDGVAIRYSVLRLSVKGDERLGNAFVDVQGNEVYPEATEVIKGLSIQYYDRPFKYYFDNEIFAFSEEKQKQMNVRIVILENGEEYVVENAQMELFVDNMTEGMLAVHDFNTGKAGFVNKYGQWVIEPKFNQVSEFRDGLACVKVDKKWGYIDHDGNFVIEPQFPSAYSFSDGYARVQMEDGKSAFIDTTGKVAIEPQYKALGSFYEGMARVSDNQTGKVGFIDTTGNLVIDCQFDDAGDFSNDMAWVEDSETDLKGYINTSGQLVIPYELECAHDFTADGFAMAGYGYHQYSFIDKEGNWLFEPQFDLTNDFSNGYATVYLNQDQRIKYDLSDGAQWKKDYTNKARLMDSIYFVHSHRKEIWTVIIGIYSVYFLFALITGMIKESRQFNKPESKEDGSPD